MRTPLVRSALAALALALAAFAAPSHAAMSRAFVFGTDWASGTVSAHALAPRVAHCDVADVGSDATLRFHDGVLYVVNRLGGDNVQVIDPATNATLRQFSVGAGSNPHDIAFTSSTKAYVSRFDATDLWIVNPATGAHTGTVALAGLADADGNPEMDRLMIAGPMLFVSLERVDRNNGYLPLDTSLVAVIDTRADTLVDCDPARPGVQGITLRLRNPFTAFQFDPDSSRLLIGCAGRFGVLDGGIERLDPVALASTSVAMTETALGGDVNDVVWGDAAKSWAIAGDLAGHTKLVSFAVTSGTMAGTVTGTLWDPGAWELTDAERSDTGELWVCDNSFASPRVRVFSTATGLAVGADLVCSQPATAITFDAESGQAAGVEPAGAAPLAFASPAPNPARTSARFAFALARGGVVRLELLDVAGRRVRTLLDAAWPAGPGGTTWDLADDRGARVAPGVYLAALRVDGAVRATRRVIVVR